MENQTKFVSSAETSRNKQKQAESALDYVPMVNTIKSYLM